MIRQTQQFPYFSTCEDSADIFCQPHKIHFSAFCAVCSDDLEEDLGRTVLVEERKLPWIEICYSAKVEDDVDVILGETGSLF
jgi:hypothetical protein